MPPEPAPLADLDQHLSQISTAWTALFQAHGTAADAADVARQRLVQRYAGAVYRYLVAAVRDPHAADDLFQEFALRLVRGDFKRAEPGRGRFRDFLKTALYHLIVDHHRRRGRQPEPLTGDTPEPVAEEVSVLESDREFLVVWRDELMSRAWAALAQVERQTGQPLHTVLRCRTDHPELRSAQLAKQLSARLGRPVTDGWVRKRLHFAREKFTDLLVEEVERSLEGRPAELEQELLDLGLLDACRTALERRGRET